MGRAEGKAGCLGCWGCLTLPAFIALVVGAIAGLVVYEGRGTSEPIRVTVQELHARGSEDLHLRVTHGVLLWDRAITAPGAGH